MCPLVNLFIILIHCSLPLLLLVRGRAVDWLELLYFKQDLTAAQVAVVNSYYNTKYGLTAA